eukprot:391292-Amorphochlora_amoeboformis.AAC.1
MKNLKEKGGMRATDKRGKESERACEKESERNSERRENMCKYLHVCYNIYAYTACDTFHVCLREIFGVRVFDVYHLQRHLA